MASIINSLANLPNRIISFSNSLTSHECQEGIFLYPSINEFPIDPICEKIVRTLQDLNWIAPGVTVELAEHKFRKRNFVWVKSIVCQDFEFHFARRVSQDKFQKVGVEKIIIRANVLKLIATYPMKFIEYNEGTKRLFLSDGNFHALKSRMDHSQHEQWNHLKKTTERVFADFIKQSTQFLLEKLGVSIKKLKS